MSETKKLKDLNSKISKIEKEYNKMSLLLEITSTKARDSTGRHLENSYESSILITDPLSTSKNVYNVWKRSSKNKQYIAASEKIAKIISRLGQKLGKLRQEKRRIEEVLEKEEMKKEMDRTKKRKNRYR